MLLFLFAAAFAACDEDSPSDLCNGDSRQIGLTLASVEGVAANRGSVAYYGRCEGVWATRAPTDDGPWTHFAIGCTDDPSTRYDGILSVAVDDSFVYVATGRHSALPKMLFRHSLASSEGDWTKADTGIPLDTVLSLLSLPNGDLWAVTANYGYYVSVDRGQSWRLGFPSGSIQIARLVQQDNSLLTFGRGSLFAPFLGISYDLGATWRFSAAVNDADDATIVGAVFADQDSSRFLIVLEQESDLTIRELDYPRTESRELARFQRFGDVIARPVGKVTVFADSLHTLEYSGTSWTWSSDPTDTQFGRVAVDWSSGAIYSWEGSSGNYRAVQVCR